MGKYYSFKSFAKLNLYLEVLNKRKDNYHNVFILFERISLYDEIFFRKRSDEVINIKSNLKELSFSPSNLTYQTVEILRKNLKIKKGIDIYIKKSIPIASGLGGGSSDSASILLGLNRLWELKLSLNELLIFAKKLGADVPFFLYNCSFALGRARGDRIKPLEIKNRFWHLLVLPSIKVLTKDVYLNLDKLENRFPKLTKPKPDVKILIKGLKEKNIGLIEKNIYNQLETVTFRLYPELNKIKTFLKEKTQKPFFMSGSGPTMFFIFSSRKEARCLKERLSKHDGFFKVILAHTV